MELARFVTEREFSDFLLRVCHDLRAPARAIRSHTELFLRDAAPDPGLAQRLEFIVDGANRIQLLADALSSYALALRIEPASFQATPMDAMLRTVVAKLEKELRTNETVVTADALPRVHGNPDRLMELLERLIRNSIVHRGADPPRIQITATKEATEWRLAVRDNGPGVDAAYLESIFNPLVHVLGGPSADTGMGLAICRVIVERHGGKIWAESRVGSGTTFLFTLPSG